MEESMSQLSCAQKHYIQGITILSPRLQNMNVMFKRPADDLLTTIPECSNEPPQTQVTQLQEMIEDMKGSGRARELETNHLLDFYQEKVQSLEENCRKEIERNNHLKKK